MCHQYFADAIKASFWSPFHDIYFQSNLMALPYILEDRTGTLTTTDFDDLYDRIFFHIARDSDGTTTKIYNMSVRGSPHRDSLPFNSKPVVALEFAANESLGEIFFMRNPQIVSIPMQNYLRRVGLFGRSDDVINSFPQTT